jgi:hypothetical protein
MNAWLSERAGLCRGNLLSYSGGSSGKKGLRWHSQRHRRPARSLKSLLMSPILVRNSQINGVNWHLHSTESVDWLMPRSFVAWPWQK